MWALGITLYMWVYGELPFNGAAPFMVYESIRKGEVNVVLLRPADLPASLI